MATRRASSFDDKRARILALASAPAPATAAAELRKYLADKNGYLCGEAAHVVQQLDLRTLIPDLATSFERLMVDGATVDKACFGKKRLLEALLAFEAGVASTYFKGLRYTQREPSYPDFVDTAAPLRGLSAHALVEIDHPTAILEVTPLLADPEPTVRAEAARALGRTGIDHAAAVLHLKVLHGDAEADVLETCFEGLLRLASQRYLPLVAAALQGKDGPRAEAAALALGQSRLREALPLLQGALDEAPGPRERQSMIMAIALLRSDEANAFLLGLVERAPEPTAIGAIEALALHRHDAAVAARVRSAVAARRPEASRRIAEALRDRFG